MKNNGTDTNKNTKIYVVVFLFNRSYHCMNKMKGY